VFDKRQSAILEDCVDKGIISRAQWKAILKEAGSPAPARAREAAKAFNFVMVFYYAGALLVLSAFGWFLGDQWNALGPEGILVVSCVYAAIFAYAGYFLQYREKFPVAGGLVFTCAVGMTPLIVYAIEAWTGVWPKTNPGTYHDYYVWINGSWIVMELATVVVSLFVLQVVRFPFLMMPASIAFWFLSMDLAEIYFPKHDLTFEQRSWVSLGVGLVILGIGWALQKSVKILKDPFWVYLAGLLAFWGGLTSLPDHGELGALVYCLINVVLIVVALYSNRKTFAVFGVCGVWAYCGHLAWKTFKDNPYFPLVLATFGLLMIVGTVVFQKNYRRIQTAIRR
jgi:hypothetical protein